MESLKFACGCFIYYIFDLYRNYQFYDEESDYDYDNGNDD